MNASKKDQVLKAARAYGVERAMEWLKSESHDIRPQTLAECRAIGYADAVMSFEQEPYFIERLTEWEHGFDTTASAAIPASGGVSVTDGPSDTATVSSDQDDKATTNGGQGRGEHAAHDDVRGTANPYYVNPDRAAYELGHLLQQLPVDFGLSPAVELRHVQMAAAVESHAHVAGNTLLSGIEAIGQLMEIAGAHAEEALPRHTVFSLGGLLQHLAVEGQYLRGIGDSMAYAVDQYGKRNQANDRKEVRHA